jgi:hypothetical protein
MGRLHPSEDPGHEVRFGGRRDGEALTDVGHERRNRAAEATAGVACREMSTHLGQLAWGEMPVEDVPEPVEDVETRERRGCGLGHESTSSRTDAASARLARWSRLRTDGTERLVMAAAAS